MINFGKLKKKIWIWDCFFIFDFLLNYKLNEISLLKIKSGGWVVMLNNFCVVVEIVNKC